MVVMTVLRTVTATFTTTAAAAEIVELLSAVNLESFRRSQFEVSAGLRF